MVRRIMKRAGQWMLPLVLLGCGSSQEASPPPPCTQIGCTDQASIVTRMSAEEAAVGAHQWVVTADGTSFTCTSAVTTAGHGDVSCGEHATAMLLPVSEGFDMPSSGGVVTHGFREVPGAFEWRLSLIGTPGAIHVVHTRDGVLVSDHTGSFTYAENAPNGVACGPVCRQAELRF